MAQGSRSAAELAHVPVLTRAVVELLAPRPGGTYVDCTVGAGGHARAILEAAGSGARLVGLDRDPEAIRLARQTLADFAQAVTLVCVNFSELEATLRSVQALPADGILFDLGVSSLQLLDPRRGFTYQDPQAPLDMRMDPGLPETAADLLNTRTVRELTRIFREFGEERWAARVAREVVRQRQRRPLAVAGELVECVYRAIPAAARRRGGHPARRIFQALRIAVNGELEHLRQALPQALRALAPGGRLVVISFHSLEDRLVKQALAQAAREGRPVPVRLLVRKALRPGPEEVQRNPRARSARLRAAERVQAWEEGRAA
ncbi:MAG TPA: 16S rRNA (cytosine(1402)-N(4))-methyltransferase RsmH [Limnochordales bacterium]